MSALAADLQAPGTASEPRCFHCGEPLAHERMHIDGKAGPTWVCCAGCAAAASWINDNGLGDYYRWRTAQGNRVTVAAADFSAWDRPDVQREHVLASDKGLQIMLAIEGMRCAACAWLIDRALSAEPGVLSASVNAVTGRLRLHWDPARTRLSLLLARVAALGYRPHLAGGDSHEQERRRERNVLLLRLGLALLAATQAMMFSEALYLDVAGEMPIATRDFFRWMTFLVCTPVVFFSGMPFIAGLWRELRLGSPGMDTLAGSAILLAYFASLVETLRGGPHVWFDAAAMFVLFLLAARALEHFARLRAQSQLDVLARAQPALAWRVGAHDTRQVPIADLQPGDVLEIPVDSAAPADGVLLDVAAAFDESLLTGESTPRGKHPGADVYAGSVAIRSSARIRVTALGQYTRLSQIQRLVVKAQAQRPTIARLADRVASRFVLVMLATSVAAALAWLPEGPDKAFSVGLAVLVAACPCALSLAVPAALSAANDALARDGVLAVGEDALTRLADVTAVMFDKTGTLTTGRSLIVSQRLFGEPGAARVDALVAALQHGSGHPLANAFAAEDRACVPLVEVHPGRGVSGWCEGVLYRMGRPDFAAGQTDDGAIWLGANGRPIARFVLQDETRAEAAESLDRLRDLQLELHLASGDAERSVSDTAAELGIDSFRARQSPEDKLAWMRSLQAQGARVMMVGDGINDSPVLAGADVAVALGQGSALAQGAADILILDSNLARLPRAIELARRTRRVLRQNLGWAVIYNGVAVCIAAAGWVHPGIAALGMVASSLGVTLNSLRLTRSGAQR